MMEARVSEVWGRGNMMHLGLAKHMGDRFGWSNPIRTIKKMTIINK